MKSGPKGYMKDSLAFLKLTWPLLLGNTLEWYEFGVYSYVEKEIADNFFDGSSLGAWLGYAVTFVARPLGGLILGIIADHCGRKLSVNLSLFGMIVATVGQGCLPGKYWGGELKLLGFILLMIFRALQGLSAGGEIGAVTAYLMEVSPVSTIGMAICMISVGSQIAWAFASAMLALLNSLLGPELMLVWGWRIPFLFSALPGFLAMWGRNKIQETEVFLSEVNDSSQKQSICGSIVELLVHYPLSLFVGIGGVCAAATMWFAPPFWTIGAVLQDLGASDALWVGNSCQLVGLAITPLAGWLADRYGVASTAFVGAAYCSLIGLPIYACLTSSSTRATAYLGVGLFFGLAQGFNGATIYLFCAELFPARLRCQGMALSYNIGVSFLGGFAAAISQTLYQTSVHIAPGVYWSATGVVTMDGSPPGPNDFFKLPRSARSTLDMSTMNGHDKDWTPFLGGERPDDLPAHMDGSLRAHLRAPSGHSFSKRCGQKANSEPGTGWWSRHPRTSS
eukprot:g26931.t1